MFQPAVYGAGPVVSGTPIVVQVPRPAGEYWKVTDWIPDAPLVGLALSVTVPRR